MRLAKLTEFRSLYYSPESAPCMNTLRSKVRRKKIAGGFMEDGHYYVDLDEYDRLHNVRAQVEDKLERLAENPVLRGLV